MMPREVIRRLELEDERSGMRTRQIQNIKIEMRKTSARNIKIYNEFLEKIKQIISIVLKEGLRHILNKREHLNGIGNKAKM